MKKYKKRIWFALFFIFIQVIITPVAVVASAQPYLYVDSAILIDADTGTVMLCQDCDQQHGIASITKLMTVYVFAQEAQQQKIKLTDEYPISERVSLLKQQSPTMSGAWYNEGQMVSVEQLLKMALIYSDNSAAVALAEIASGSEQAHVEKMNQQAQEWGMTNTMFYTASGLTMRDYGVVQLPGTSSNDYNVSSAREIALMAKYIIDAYPQILTITKQTSVIYNNEELYTWNLMLPDQVHYYEGVSGLKTGSSIEAGSCFAGYYTYNDHNYISVVLGASDTDARFTQTAVMYDWINTQIINDIITTDYTIEVNLAGDVGFNNRLHPINNIDATDSNELNMELSSVTYNSEYFDSSGRLAKTIPAGETVAEVSFTNFSTTTGVTTVYGDSQHLVIPLVSDNTIRAQGWFLSFFSAIGIFFQKLFYSIL